MWPILSKSEVGHEEQAYHLVLGRMAPESTYNVVIPDLAAQAEQYFKFIYLICAREEDHFQATSRNYQLYLALFRETLDEFH